VTDRAPALDARTASEIWPQVRDRSRGYLAGPLPGGSTAGLGRVFARYLEALLQRLNQAPDKNRIAFFELLGFEPVTAQSARVPIVFQLATDASDSAAPEGTEVAAPPPAGSTTPIAFETESSLGVAAATLAQLVSFWPGRDEYIDHTADLRQGLPLKLFDSRTLGPTPHVLYLGHQTLLALAGASRLQLEVDLAQGGSERLEIAWEYWDGKVWRGFQSLGTGCNGKAGEVATDTTDGTLGLTRSGSITLTTDCAKTALVAVNGVESFWIRGRLTQTLPPNPARVLPLVEGLELLTRIERPLGTRAKVLYTEWFERERSVVFLKDAVGGPLSDVTVRVTSPDHSGFDPVEGTSDSTGTVLTLNGPKSFKAGKTYRFEIPTLGVEAVVEEPNNVSDGAAAWVSVDGGGLPLEKAFSGTLAIDVSKPFYPFGQQPQPGATFYFSQSEVFSKPGASVRAYALGASAPQDSIQMKDVRSDATPADNDLPHTVSWEYWNGQRWSALLPSPVNKPPGDLKGTQLVEFEVPRDLESTEVNGEPGLWMRVRLVSGGFGFTRELTFETHTTSGPITLTYVVPQPPVLADFRLGYVWQKTAKLERVFTYDDFGYEDHTDDALWPGKTFPAYRPVSDLTPALYLGFDRPLPVANAGLYFNVTEQAGEDRGPALVWEYWNGGGWRRLTVQDGTRRIRLPGIVSFIAPGDSRPLPRFDAKLHWLRARLVEDGPPGEPTISTLLPNAVWASQRRSFRDVALGTSNGIADATFVVTQVPVLAGEKIEVRELVGPRANVEWRLLALELSGGDPNFVRTFERMLEAEGNDPDFVQGRLRLRRDRTKKVVEAWVRWEGRRNLYFSDENDRHYVLQRSFGRLRFGDGIRGRIPPLGAAILAREFRSGGGRAGNVRDRTITQLLGPVPGVQSVFNPRSAEGGADGETPEAFSRRAPATLRHRGGALDASDYETLAREASASVAFARAIPGRRPDGRSLPGYVTVLIAPQSEDPRPVPSFGLREQVRAFLEAHAPADVAGGGGIDVVAPDYLPLDVIATLAPARATDAGAVEIRARAALTTFLHPLRGGPDGRGWDLGRDVFVSDVARILGAVEGVDHVEDLEILVDGSIQGDSVPVGPERIVVPGKILLRLVEAAVE
jgi:hypothetical protein